MCLLVAVVMAAPQSGGAKGPRISRDQWAALNPYGYGPAVPEDIQRQWDSFLVDSINCFAKR